jgi:Glycosidases
MFPYNSRDPQYKLPFGAVRAGEEVKIVFPSPAYLKDSGVYLVLRGKKEGRRIALNLLKTEGGYKIYEARFSISQPDIIFYRFEVSTARGFIFVGSGRGGEAFAGDWLPEWQLTVYAKDYETPDFLKGGIVYHIFPDRFARVEDGKEPRRGRLKKWTDDVELGNPYSEYKADDFFGGNIKGVISRLDYLKELSVSVIYFSPVFESSSNHRYDTGDYSKIDSLFGSEDEFRTLIGECEKRGISIILDGVFNHTGADSVYFNKFGHYDSLGAYESEKSPYYGWYEFKEYPDEYSCWWGITVVPSVKKDCREFQEMIAGKGGIIETRMREGIKGFRLDVADELSSPFLEKIRKKVKEYGGLVIGEVWEDASGKISYSERREYFLGNQLDGVTNYPFRNAIIDYIKSGNAAAFKNSVDSIIENYPKPSLDSSLVLLGTHDTVRIINELSALRAPKDKAERRALRLTGEEYKKAKEKVKIAAVLQYFLPGVPCVYYGDEIGMDGFEDPINRRPMNRNAPDTDLLNHYIRLGKLRCENREDFIAPAEIYARGSELKIKRGEIVLIITAAEDGFIWRVENK